MKVAYRCRILKHPPVSQDRFDRLHQNGKIRGIVNDGEIDSEPDTVTIVGGEAPTNRPPTITSTPPTRAVVGSEYRYAVVVQDPDPGETLTFTLETGPWGMVIDPDAGVLRWRPKTTDVARA